MVVTKADVMAVKENISGLTMSINGMLNASDGEEANAWVVIYNKAINRIYGQIDELAKNIEADDEEEDDTVESSEIADRSTDPMIVDKVVNEFIGE